MSALVSEKDNKGLIFNIQKFSIHDGPGIRTTVFMKGCSLSCKWCSNPESIKSHPEIMVHDMRCIQSRKCEERCPTGAISFNEKGRQIDWTKCNQCLECAKACPSKAIDRVGNYMTVDEVVKKVEEDRTFYQNSGGGMSISGGEPLLQWKFVRELFKRCKDKNIHTVLDTTGNAPWSSLEKVLKYVDLVLYDIKHMDTKKHKEGTGVENELILKNAEKTVSRVRTWLRFPILPFYNDTEKNIKQVAEFALKIKVEKVSILPYHEWGVAKYLKLGRTYLMEGITPPNELCVQWVKEKFESCGIKVEIGR